MKLYYTYCVILITCLNYSHEEIMTKENGKQVESIIDGYLAVKPAGKFNNQSYKMMMTGAEL